MGNEQSSSAEYHSSLGYHVLAVTPSSPADEAGIEPYFDYILYCNQERLDNESTLLKDTIQANNGAPVSLIVYSSKTDGVREVTLTPSLQPDQSVTGLKVRFCDYENASENIWHILSVQPDSPAEQSGLRPETDYIIGTPHKVLYDKEDLFDLIAGSRSTPLQLWVYSTESDLVREVIVLPKFDGEQGSLGCDIGYGYLHRIPTKPNTQDEYIAPSDRELEMLAVDSDGGGEGDVRVVKASTTTSNNTQQQPNPVPYEEKPASQNNQESFIKDVPDPKARLESQDVTKEDPQQGSAPFVQPLSNANEWKASASDGSNLQQEARESELKNQQQKESSFGSSQNSQNNNNQQGPPQQNSNNNNNNNAKQQAPLVNPAYLASAPPDIQEIEDSFKPTVASKGGAMRDFKPHLVQATPPHHQQQQEKPLVGDQNLQQSSQQQQQQQQYPLFGGPTQPVGVNQNDSVNLTRPLPSRTPSPPKISPTTMAQPSSLLFANVPEPKQKTFQIPAQMVPALPNKQMQ